MYAFCSVAENRVGPHSDLDLLVVRETALVGPERGADLVVEARLEVAFDLVVVTPQEFRDRLPQTSFGRTILRPPGVSMQRDRFAVARTWLHSAERDVVVAKLALEVEPALAAFDAQQADVVADNDLGDVVPIEDAKRALERSAREQQFARRTVEELEATRDT